MAAPVTHASADLRGEGCGFGVELAHGHGACQTGGMTAPSSADDIITLRIELAGSDPTIWRELDVPTTVALKQLHDIIQAAFGWLDYHLWEFSIGSERYGLLMDEDWGTAPRKLAARTRLGDVLSSGTTAMTYLYDFGDDWEHRLFFSNRRPATPGIA